jgi:uncharacterized membrane protein YoaK (UPF0700 family)
MLAAYLAAVAGFVNSGGYLVIGSFTSHVTGSVGRFGNDLITHDTRAALLALLLVFTFFLGAFFASLILELRFRTRPNAYGTALFAEGALLASFVLAAGLGHTTATHWLDLQAAILCMAMGMQNSMVTRLSGAVVRTTHLTGVITDLGIEAAHWYQWVRRLSLPRASRPPKRPAPARALLLLTITVAFTCGAVSGAGLTLALHFWAMLLPVVAIFGASAYAFYSARLPGPASARNSERASARPPAADGGTASELSPSTATQSEPRA